MVRLGKENSWLKIEDVQATNFVRSRYYLNWKIGKFITDYKDVKDFEVLPGKDSLYYCADLIRQ
jgi:hypothetical protein